MDIFIFPIIFLIWAAISILLLLRTIFSIHMAKTFIYFSFVITQELYQWTRFLSWIAILNYTGHFWWMVLQTIFVVPITFYSFFWYVYDFGPKHCKQTLYNIIMNPVPGVEFEVEEADDFEALWCQRFNNNIVAWWIACTKQLAMKRITKSNMSVLHDCPILHITLDAPQLHGYKTYYTSQDNSSGKHVNESEHNIPMTLYFAVCHFSSPDNVFLELPRMPPKGYTTFILVKLIITGIFGIVTLQTCSCMWKQICVAKIKAFIWWQTDRPIEAGLKITLDYRSGDGRYHDGHLWNKGLLRCDPVHCFYSPWLSIFWEVAVYLFGGFCD